MIDMRRRAAPIQSCRALLVVLALCGTLACRHEEPSRSYQLRGQILAVKANDWAYATRKLTFNDTPMEEVIQILEKTYQQPVNVSNNQIKRCSLNGKFDNVSLEKLLTFVAESLNLSLTKNDNGFILQGEGCP